ncbi:hypothetical protein N7460_004017, partial [Penicillium canescens]
MSGQRSPKAQAIRFATTNTDTTDTIPYDHPRGLPLVLISDRDPKFVQAFWKALKVDLVHSIAPFP